MPKQWIAKLRNSKEFYVYGESFDTAWNNAMDLQRKYGRSYRVISIVLS